MTKSFPNILHILASIAFMSIIGVANFAPQLTAITTSAYSPAVSNDLTGRAKTWETLSLVRLGSLLILAVVLLNGLSVKTEGK